MRKRNKFNLSHYNITSGDMGKLYPVQSTEILPGDTIRGSTSALVRFEEMLRPLMHPVEVRLHHFFVPYRLIWSDWENFITDRDAVPPVMPTLAGAAPAVGTVLDHLNIYNDTTNTYNTLAVRCYNDIYNHYYIDQDLSADVASENINIQHVQWEKDIFTTARSQPGVNDTITIPIQSDGTPPTFNNGTDYKYLETNAASTNTDWSGAAAAASGNMEFGSTSDPELTGLEMDLRSFKEQFAMQSYQEARKKYGDEYVDYLRYYGITPSDSRMQRPEYLGGGKATVAISEVLDTGVAAGSVGKQYGHGIAAVKTKPFTKFFEEHGQLMTMLSVRPKAIYTEALPYEVTRTLPEHFFQKELEHIGDREVYTREIDASQNTTETEVFGYQDRYDEYRRKHSFVSGQMRTSFNDYHLGRVFTAKPTLNSTFVRCDPSKRIFQTGTDHSMQIMVNNKTIARRLVSKRQREVQLW